MGVQVIFLILIIKSLLRHPLILRRQFRLIRGFVLVDEGECQSQVVFGVCVEVGLIVFDLITQLFFLPLIDIVALTAIRVQLNIIGHFHPRL